MPQVQMIASSGIQFTPGELILIGLAVLCVVLLVRKR